MKIWELEREYSALLAFVNEGRNRKRRNVKRAVETIKKTLETQKERALVEFSKEWDRWDREYPLKLTAGELRIAASKIEKKDVAVLKGMIRNARSYHRGQKPPGRIYRKKGVVVRESFVPVEKALVYVPGGTAAYPSSLVMGAVPAQIAGVKKIFVTSPAAKGQIHPYVAAACKLLGITDVYRLGGAQAIYAFSYGIGSVPKVDMIVGPGNAYVEEAKRDVYGHVGIDMLAGPTELVILCTEPFSASAVAWDMFSQAEHDEMAMVGLFSSSKAHIKDVGKEMQRLIASNERRDVIEKALENNSFIVHYKNVDRAIEAINRIAPEHMELIGDEKRERDVLYPGVVYLGRHTTVAMGDYYIGTNHILPTGGAGRFTAGLSVDRFTKRKVLVKINKDFLRQYGDNAVRLSRIEGLYAHGEAIKARKEL
ncbi:MAG TPA: histidinol dehydrogenase [Syntrophorhabdaceae bacterium]|nr:histidinol dehydrogenase [Syntrophorhabdaceae bacterium]HQM81552.1 histidinol dehydrogenase [Syntrophorhabdaceae bacterium]